MKMKLTDEARLYYEEVQERTHLAHHADRRHRSGDVFKQNTYTDAELQKRNGPVRTYSVAQRSAPGVSFD